MALLYLEPYPFFLQIENWNANIWYGVNLSSIPNSERISYPNPKKILKDIKALHVPNSAFSLVHRMFYFCTLFSFYELLHICNTCCTAFRYLGMCNNSSARPKLMYLNSFMCWYKTTFSDKNIYFVNRKLKHSPIKEEFSHMVLTSYSLFGLHRIDDLISKNIPSSISAHLCAWSELRAAAKHLQGW